MYAKTLTLFSLLFAASTLAEPRPRPTPAPFDLSNLGNLGSSMPDNFPCDIKDTACISSFVRGVVTSATANPTLIGQASGALAAATQFAGESDEEKAEDAAEDARESNQDNGIFDNSAPSTAVTGTSAALAVAVWAMAFIL